MGEPMESLDHRDYFGAVAMTIMTSHDSDMRLHRDLAVLAASIRHLIRLLWSLDRAGEFVSLFSKWLREDLRVCIPRKRNYMDIQYLRPNALPVNMHGCTVATSNPLGESDSIIDDPISVWCPVAPCGSWKRPIHHKMAIGPKWEQNQWGKLEHTNFLNSFGNLC